MTRRVIGPSWYARSRFASNGRVRKPRPRRRFLNVGDELNHLNNLVRWWAAVELLESVEGVKAVDRFQELLNASGTDDGSIMLQEHWAVYFGAVGDRMQALRHRVREVALVERLVQIGSPDGTFDQRYLAELRDEVVRLELNEE